MHHLDRLVKEPFVVLRNFTNLETSKQPSGCENKWRRRNVPRKTSKTKKASTRKKGKKGSVMETLRKKAAKSKLFTASQLKKSYDKGLAAYASSGSRKGMSSHQWAMARVNSVLRGGKARSIDFPSKGKKKKSTTRKKKK
jgi:hypothetical protein